LAADSSIHPDESSCRRCGGDLWQAAVTAPNIRRAMVASFTMILRSALVTVGR
jgi:hypothetical protein